jgi:hypothetical protein
MYGNQLTGHMEQFITRDVFSSIYRPSTSASVWIPRTCLVLRTGKEKGESRNKLRVALMLCGTEGVLLVGGQLAHSAS